MNLYYSETLSIDSYNGFHLVQDHIGTNHSSAWNDYDYIVKFKIYHVKDGEVNKLGYIRTLINGYEDTSKYFIEKGVLEKPKIYNITGVMNEKDSVSLPLDIDFYNILKKILKKDEINELLSLICDASFFYSNYNTYKDWPGFNGSIMRDGSASEAILRKGHQIAMGNYVPKKSFKILLDNVSDTIDPVEFYFNNSREFERTNINLIIGRNGVGKTHLLKSLTESITGLKSHGDDWPYFHKLIVVAYSPFEDFYTKDDILDKIDEKYSKNGKPRKPKSKDRRRLNVNEYAYVGFRKENGNFDKDWPKNHSIDSLIKIMDFDDDNWWWDNDNTRLNKLLETLSLSIKFDHLAVKLKDQDELFKIDNNLYKQFKEIKNKIVKEDGIFFIKNGEALKLSSGQKIYSYMLPAIVAEIEDESLIILDEPELYLHPSLEIGLINMLKFLLNETSSYAIIATHSAVLAREVDRKGVTILRHNEENNTEVITPNIQTYGESLELIIGEAFDDYVTPKPFQKVIDKLIEKHESPQEVLSSYSKSMGDEALTYLASKITHDSDFEVEDE
ncbi:AAA family ATPase [Photobacterium alginatilyticum]|uniref:ATP-binding protein n=1 Tax=Photobacterium alginatilyticum TaxID=1775171 RepID=A0ABW9YN58_9GAMM|nr:AAA family ATPase [Photobacterium alginatilyticum]NBI54666.1 ATP-binding protein [Photobacterium alginatilyticum]